MALLKESDLKIYLKASNISLASASARKLDYERFDVFLSHSYLDKNLVFAIKNYLEEYGVSVYVDWIDEPELDRSSVDAETAATLRKRMSQCKSLLFATSSNSTSSKWMPWECGYFDGINGKVAIFPIAKSDENSFSGQEYLGLYPYIDVAAKEIWINSIKSGHCNIKDWLNGKSPD
ncbi:MULTISPECIES: TIR domain-containing protein [Pectobacterium]|uniref:TIR domain-containing protein n=1 Tax=Pectobacterium TaxID=122277 RepID=UPI000E764648|nr:MULTISPECIES: TIR domain-containing protein [Pectobacterium]RJL48674.1 TIR domain-containing protein [Pectobacterium carotovorum]UUE56013.1 toll/interleukin-1 receptor domain-containing protein [Pectobacterium aroidearum]UUE68673.1 toll/interleukin-1 receptor domain-containing protein [Pectobacterium aroidearum]UUE73039.1 toll/interleukin-1 receptor domain-containing protein [Pectobacterium aroidearum]UUE77380.1 toll/interleukin-1 receptor domain-containing protein [Pectobacterium aroidearu